MVFLYNIKFINFFIQSFSELFIIKEDWKKIQKYLKEVRELLELFVGKGNINEFIDKNLEASLITENYCIFFKYNKIYNFLFKYKIFI